MFGTNLKGYQERLANK